MRNTSPATYITVENILHVNLNINTTRIGKGTTFYIHELNINSPYTTTHTNPRVENLSIELTLTIIKLTLLQALILMHAIQTLDLILVPRITSNSNLVHMLTNINLSLTNHNLDIKGVD
jgi:hypothetical protein